MQSTLKKTITNQHGFVLGTSILVSAVLILAGVFAVWMANTEMLLVRNESQMIREFYDAEAGVVDAIENYNVPPTRWLTNDFLLDGDDASSSIDYLIDGDPVANVEVRCVLKEQSDTALTEAAPLSTASSRPLSPLVTRKETGVSPRAATSVVLPSGVTSWIGVPGRATTLIVPLRTRASLGAGSPAAEESPNTTGHGGG